MTPSNIISEGCLNIDIGHNFWSSNSVKYDETWWNWWMLRFFPNCLGLYHIYNKINWSRSCKLEAEDGVFHTLRFSSSSLRVAKSFAIDANSDLRGTAYRLLQGVVWPWEWTIILWIDSFRHSHSSPSVAACIPIIHHY